MSRIWNLASTKFPDGGIGRFSAEDIALDIDYEGDQDELIRHLTECRFLDEIPAEQGSLYVHDWHEHAEGTTHRWLARNQKCFANGELPNFHHLPTRERGEFETWYRANVSVPDNQSRLIMINHDQKNAPPSRARALPATATATASNAATPPDDPNGSSCAQARARGSVVVVGDGGDFAYDAECPLDSPEGIAANLLVAGGYQAVFAFTGAPESSADRDLLIEALAAHLREGEVFNVGRLQAVTERTKAAFAEKGRGHRTVRWWVNQLGDMIREGQAEAGQASIDPALAREIKTLEEKYGTGRTAAGLHIRAAAEHNLRWEQRMEESRIFKQQREAAAAAKELAAKGAGQ